LITINCPLDVVQPPKITDDAFHGVSEQCFKSPPTQYRLYGRRF